MQPDRLGHGSRKRLCQPATADVLVSIEGRRRKIPVGHEQVTGVVEETGRDQRVRRSLTLRQMGRL